VKQHEENFIIINKISHEKCSEGGEENPRGEATKALPKRQQNSGNRNGAGENLTNTIHRKIPKTSKRSKGGGQGSECQKKPSSVKKGRNPPVQKGDPTSERGRNFAAYVIYEGK